jgi:hypothetical protein
MAVGLRSHPTDVNFDWLVKHITRNTNEHVHDMWQRYMWTIVKPAKDETNDQTEIRWLSTLTGVTSKLRPDMWSQAVVGLGKTPGKSIQENQEIYFRNAT